MGGRGDATLSVFVRTSDNASASRLLFTALHSASSADVYWKRADVRVSNSTLLLLLTGGGGGGDKQSFQLVVQGALGRGESRAEIGLDDTTFTPACAFDDSDEIAADLVDFTQPGEAENETTTTNNNKNTCPLGQFKCSSSLSSQYEGIGQCVPAESVCNFVRDCENGSDELACGTCDFEASWCGYRDASSVVGGGEFAWTRHRASSVEHNGPRADHTYRNASGHFLMCSLNSQLSLDNDDDVDVDARAILLGPAVQRTSTRCELSAWIYAPPGDYKIDIYFTLDGRASNMSVNEKLLTKVKSNGGGGGESNVWRNHVVTIGEHSAGHRLKIVAASARNEWSLQGIGIDDTVFSNCAPTTGVFQCNNGVFIPDNLVKLLLVSRRFFQGVFIVLSLLLLLLKGV